MKTKSFIAAILLILNTFAIWTSYSADYFLDNIAEWNPEISKLDNIKINTGLKFKNSSIWARYISSQTFLTNSKNVLKDFYKSSKISYVLMSDMLNDLDYMTDSMNTYFNQYSRFEKTGNKEFQVAANESLAEATIFYKQFVNDVIKQRKSTEKSNEYYYNAPYYYNVNGLYYTNYPSSNNGYYNQKTCYYNWNYRSNCYYNWYYYYPNSNYNNKYCYYKGKYYSNCYWNWNEYKPVNYSNNTSTSCYYNWFYYKNCYRYSWTNYYSNNYSSNYDDYTYNTSNSWIGCNYNWNYYNRCY